MHTYASMHILINTYILCIYIYIKYIYHSVVCQDLPNTHSSWLTGSPSLWLSLQALKHKKLGEHFHKSQQNDSGTRSLKSGALAHWGPVAVSRETPGSPALRLLRSLGSALSGSSARQLLLLVLEDAPGPGHRRTGSLQDGRWPFSVS